MKCIISVVVALALANVIRAEDPWTPSPLCPYPSNEITRSPYEGDCSKYWECYQGARYVMTCPDGLEYNAKESRCDSPEIAQCDKDATITYPTYTTPNFVPDPMCPYPSSELVYFPCPTNCSQYYQCYQGVKYLKDCPANQYWSVDHDWCDWLENVDCSKNNGTTVPGVTTTTVTSTPWTPDPLCPYPSDSLTFFPKADNCSQYWECFQGNKFLMNCPGDLLWNVVSEACDYKDNVDCSATIGPTTSTTTTSTTTTNSTATTGPTTPSTTTTTGPNVCAGQPDGTFFPNPYDCSKFYECVGSQIVDMQCPANLYWNPTANTCDRPENVNCIETKHLF